MLDFIEAPSAGADSAAPTTTAALDRAVTTVREKARAFARLPVRAKVALLRTTVTALSRVAHAWVAQGSKVKGLREVGPESGEEWFAGPMPTVRNARLLAVSLEQIAEHGRPSFGRAARVRKDQRIEVDVFPAGGFDAALHRPFFCRVLLQPGWDEWTARQKQASFYQAKEPEGKVSLVLGAGNVSSIPAMDVLYKMFVEGRTCVLKMNPVNEWAGPFLEQGLAPLMRADYLRVVYGGAAEGEYLCQHAGVDDIHITGSNRTHDRIVWGPPGPEQERRRRANEPLLQKNISSELGNVSPLIVVPGDYTEEELWFQARNIVTMVGNNASFNCNAAKLLVTSRQWKQREHFLELLARAFGQLRPRKAYYPGARHRYDELLDGRTGVRTFGEAAPESLPWALVTDLDSKNTAEPLFQVEPFCALLSETALYAEGAASFLAIASRFCNERLWGTLNAAIIIDPRTEANPEAAHALERAIVELRYGTVAVNHWPAVVYAATSPPWGAYPGATLADIQSGSGFVHNTFMLEGIEKSVLRGPIVLSPKPAWFYDNTMVHVIGERLTEFEASPSALKLPGLALAALRG